MGSEGATTSRRRILDYLNDGEELGVEVPGSPRAVAAARSLLPRFRWARMARLGRKAGGSCAGVKGRQPRPQLQEQEVAEEKGPEESSSAPACAAAADGGGGEARPADLGIGMGLVFLLAKTSDEFGRMAKVRAEMETLLAEFKAHVNVVPSDAHTHDDVARARGNVESAASSCLTDGNELRAANANANTRSEEEDHRVASSSGGVGVEVSSRRRSTEDVLEEEFHAELERLRVHYAAGTPPFAPAQEHEAAESSGDDDDDIGADCRQGFAEDDYDDHGHDDDEDEDDDDDDAARYRGVSAVELERRLHELLHQRNQDRIEELEAALRRAERRLFDKEMEASLWKDTAKMALRQDGDDDDELQ